MTGNIPIGSGLRVLAEDNTSGRALMVNWMVDADGAMVPRPGIVSTQLDPGEYAATSGTDTGIVGHAVWHNVTDGYDYVVYGRKDRTLWAKNLTSNVTTALSSSGTPDSLLGGGGRLVFTADSQRLVIACGGELLQWTGSGLASRIATYVGGTNQPPLAGTHVVSLGNYLVANSLDSAANKPKIFWSNLGDGNHTTWDPLNFNTADASVDSVVALAGTLTYVYAFKETVMQVFGLTSDPALPFQSSNSIRVGCGATYSPIATETDVYWLDDQRRFVHSDGSTFELISADVDREIKALSTASDCWGFRIVLGAVDQLVWIFPTANVGYVYERNGKRWSTWQSWNGVDGLTGPRIGAYAFYPAQGWHIVADSKYENLWTLDSATHEDSAYSAPLVCDRVTQRMDWGTDARKRCNHVRLFLRRGTTATGSTTSKVEVAKRDDEGEWSSFTQLDLGNEGDYRNWIDWYPGGVYRRRQYRFRYSGTADVSISAAVEDYRVLEQPAMVAA